ncbi:MAG: IS66 family insertion sequence element accessory protein TnpA [Blautia faecis]
MSKKRAPGRSLDEWMELVIECRQSGLTDAAWCNEHGISPSCFYNAVTRLRKKSLSDTGSSPPKPALLTLHPINRM